MLDWAASVERHSHPFNWALIKGLLTNEMANELVATFPVDLSHTVRNSGSDKTYDVRNRVLQLEARNSASWSNSVWGRLLDVINGQDYRHFLEATIGRSLQEATIQLEVNEYHEGGFMSVHTDRPPKIVSHLIYLNARWPRSWGGQLALFKDPNHEPVVLLDPALPISVVLLRSDVSWHQVKAISSEALEPRRTIQITFWDGAIPQSPLGRQII